MLTNDGKLAVFESFRPDRRLPKFNPPTGLKKDTNVVTTKMQQTTSEGWPPGDLSLVMSSNSTAITSPTLVWNTTSSSPAVASKSFDKYRVRWYDKFLPFLAERRRNAKTKDPIPAITIEQYFSSIKNSAEELKEVAERAAGYEARLKQAKLAGQTALYERLKDGLVATKAEAQLFAVGMRKYIEEQVVVDFTKKSPKGLTLTWLENFVRVIPDDVVAKKIKADELGIFDNYVVLAYDPESKASAPTKAEIEKKKDPILFGIIEGKRRLYFVGDWIDEFCDLTLDQLADKVGKDSIKELT
jgi:hypothetical protein